MRLAAAFLGLTFAVLGPSAVCHQTDSGQKSSGHKSEFEIARMTPEERVREYCNECVHHDVWHRDYSDMLSTYIRRDGIKAVPAMIKLIDEFDPNKTEGETVARDANSHWAEILLGTLDGASFRLRAFGEGKAAIEAVRRVVERMHAAHFDSAPSRGEHSPEARYKMTLIILEQLQGISLLDRSVRDTFEFRHGIMMRDDELLDFSNYLTSQDPYYPAWSETEWYADRSRLNEAGNALQYQRVKNIEPFYKAYLKFKGRRR